MGTVPHEVWVSALPRLLAASMGLALLAALIIRLTWRPRRSPLSYRSTRRAAHARPPLKSGSAPAAGSSPSRSPSSAARR